VTQSTKKTQLKKQKKIKILCRGQVRHSAKIALPRVWPAGTRQRTFLCRRAKRKALGKGDGGHRRLVDRDFAESAPLPSAWLSLKSLFADRLISALGKEPFAKCVT